MRGACARQGRKYLQLYFHAFDHGEAAYIPNAHLARPLPRTHTGGILGLDRAAVAGRGGQAASVSTRIWPTRSIYLFVVLRGGG